MRRRGWLLDCHLWLDLACARIEAFIQACLCAICTGDLPQISPVRQQLPPASRQQRMQDVLAEIRAVSSVH